jgi:hypothetical protein
VDAPSARCEEFALNCTSRTQDWPGDLRFLEKVYAPSCIPGRGIEAVGLSRLAVTGRWYKCDGLTRQWRGE